jgi:hypothetical protein
MAVEVATIAGGLPFPRVSALLKSVTEAIPEEVATLLTTATEELTAFTSENDLGSLVDDIAAAGNQTKQMPQRPTVALRQVKMLRLLLVALGDKDCKKTGLEQVYRTEDGACTWVCSSAQSTCYETFLQHGRAALLIDVALT